MLNWLFGPSSARVRMLEEENRALRDYIDRLKADRERAIAHVDRLDDIFSDLAISYSQSIDRLIDARNAWRDR